MLLVSSVALVSQLGTGLVLCRATSLVVCAIKFGSVRGLRASGDVAENALRDEGRRTLSLIAERLFKLGAPLLFLLHIPMLVFNKLLARDVS